MSTETIIYTPYHSAIPSWSGYQYQGKVALNVVLDYMMRISPDEYESHSLELEWYEDFCILNGETYISIHQVKSYKAKGLSEYKEAIWNLLGKTLLKSCESCYLHSASDLDTEEEIKKGLLNLDPPPMPKPPKDPLKGPKIKTYSPRHYHDQVMAANAYEELFSKFSCYSYASSKRYCPLNELEDEIKQKIKSYYDHRGQNCTVVQIEAVYHYLLGEVDRHITRRHYDEQIDDATEIDFIPDRIWFTEIYQVLENNWEKPSDEYVILRLRNMFHSIWDSFSIDLHQKTIDEGTLERQEDIRKVEQYVSTLSSLSNSDFFTFCQIVTPNIHIPKADEDAFRNLIPEDGIGTLLYAFYEIKRELDVTNYRYVKKIQSINTSYLPTTLKLISNRYRSDDTIKSSIASSILSNAAIRNQLYEIEVMITDNINAKSLEEAAMKFTAIETDDGNPNDKVTKIKKIRMIDIDIAKGELNQ
ncbi:ABC-three component system protein [Paenibacillus sp. GM2]|uniref:ABC-three component system protein n=1 Tax=Paenibacillus sp. GM2 TaxID=1622070 RepID=UPI000838C727|nr:ABC-three component system protein [Paenibacillus sp. GM2]